MSPGTRAARDDAAGVRRLLKGLTEEGAALRKAKGWHVLVSPSAASRQEVRVPKSLGDICLRQDWLERSGKDLVLSEVGRAMLRRSEAGGDAFREQHQLRTAQLKEIDGTRRPVLVNEAESPLG